MGEWEFYRIPASGVDEAPPFRWCWRSRQPDGSMLETPETFRFLLDCIAHARLHGYSNGPLQTRREPPEWACLSGTARTEGEQTRHL